MLTENTNGHPGSGSGAYPPVPEPERSAQHPDPAVDPRGSAEGDSRVLRGGSYLCHDSYCNRYRVAARIHNSPESTSGNTGFRVAR